MRVLILHNRYRQKGGEDSVVSAETNLLRAHGVEVLVQVADNPAASTCQTITAGFRAAWSGSSYELMRSICKDFRPDIAHVHNFWMKLSPSVHSACRHSGVATVQTLHNPRLLCVNALFLRDGKPCEDCLGKVPWRGVVHRCYRNSLLASSAVGAMVLTNRLRHTWDTDVDAYITLSGYARDRFERGGFPPERLFVKPNFVDDPGETTCKPSATNRIVFLGRFSREKGLATLLSAWAQGGLSKWGSLAVIGDGPERSELERHAAELGLGPPSFCFTGWKNPAETRQILESARALVLPSLVHEAFPMSVVEALSFGRPVLVSRLEGLLQIVPPNTLTASPGNLEEWAAALRILLASPELADELGRSARIFYLTRYTPDRNYSILMDIYRHAMEHRGKRVIEWLKSAGDPLLEDRGKQVSAVAGCRS